MLRFGGEEKKKKKLHCSKADFQSKKLLLLESIPFVSLHNTRPLNSTVSTNDLQRKRSTQMKPG